MQGLYYLAFIIAIFVVIQWYVSTERARDPAKGLLAMKKPGATDKRKPKRGRLKWPRPGAGED
jgi:hypothetical protein